jgi:hypothetical protein
MASSPTMELLKSKTQSAAAQHAAAEMEEQDISAIASELEGDEGDGGSAGVQAETAQASVPATGKEKGTQTIIGPDLISKAATEIENVKDGDTATKQLKALLDSTDYDEFRIGGYLAVIQTQGWYAPKYENFRQFVELELDWGYRKAVYLTSTYTRIVEAGITWQQVQGVGWAKLKELAKVLTKENVTGWVEKAKEVTTPQLIEMINHAQLASPEGAGSELADTAKKVSTLSLKVFDDQKETIKEAIAKAKVAANTDSDSVALEMACLDYLAGTTKKKEPTLEELMNKAGWEAVLQAFEKLFPSVNVSVEAPE